MQMFISSTQRLYTTGHYLGLYQAVQTREKVFYCFYKMWPGKRKRTLTLYRLTVETIYYPFKMDHVKRLNAFLIRL